MRIKYVFACLATVALGMGTRRYSQLLPAFVSGHFGDALWASMVYFGFRFIFVHKSMALAVILSLIFSFAIEISQLYQADWINEIRNTLLGSLILGRGFLAVDLIRYVIGIMIAYIIDYSFLRRN